MRFPTLTAQLVHSNAFDWKITDTQGNMLQGEPRSAICVQNFDDSLSFAIHITYRISLRSSSLREPRHPSLKVVHYYEFEEISPTLQVIQ